MTHGKSLINHLITPNNMLSKMSKENTSDTGVSDKHS